MASAEQLGKPPFMKQNQKMVSVFLMMVRLSSFYVSRYWCVSKISNNHSISFICLFLSVLSSYWGGGNKTRIRKPGELANSCVPAHASQTLGACPCVTHPRILLKCRFSRRRPGVGPKSLHSSQAPEGSCCCCSVALTRSRRF